MKTSAGALIFNKERLLILKPSYRDYWLFPGGAIEDHETPSQACIRETYEETKLQLEIKRLLCVDYLTRGTEIIGISSKRILQKAEITYLFLGSEIDEAQSKLLEVDGKEIVDYQFLPPEECLPLLPNYLQTRLPFCLQAIEQNTILYLEKGKELAP
jgi:8-oxo-dGTP diphosphatase